MWQHFVFASISVRQPVIFSRHALHKNSRQKVYSLCSTEHYKMANLDINRNIESYSMFLDSLGLENLKLPLMLDGWREEGRDT